ncbi:MAG TPA: CoA-binding protein [Mucilaginibacter sp.]
MADIKRDPPQILKSAKNILLVDWPDQGVPRALINAGFTVFSFSPGSYSEAKIIADPPDDQKDFSPRNHKENGYLIFQNLTGSPDFVDIVNIYRPEEEHQSIIENHVIPLNAKAVWLHPPITSAHTAAIASEKGLVFIEGVNIVEVASKI